MSILPSFFEKNIFTECRILVWFFFQYPLSSTVLHRKYLLLVYCKFCGFFFFPIWLLLRLFYLSLVWSNLIMIYLVWNILMMMHSCFQMFLCLRFMSFLAMWVYSFHQFWKILPLFLEVIFLSALLSLLPWELQLYVCYCLSKVFHTSLMLCSFFYYKSIFLCDSFGIFYIVMFSSSLMFYSAILNL